MVVTNPALTGGSEVTLDRQQHLGLDPVNRTRLTGPGSCAHYGQVTRLPIEPNALPARRDASQYALKRRNGHKRITTPTNALDARQRVRNERHRRVSKRAAIIATVGMEVATLYECLYLTRG